MYPSGGASGTCLLQLCIPLLRACVSAIRLRFGCYLAVIRSHMWIPVVEMVGQARQRSNDAHVGYPNGCSPKVLFELLFANPQREIADYGPCEHGVEKIIAIWSCYLVAIPNRLRFRYCLSKTCYSDLRFESRYLGLRSHDH